MCFAFTRTEEQLTARSRTEHGRTPPAMTKLVDRGSEKRTGVKGRKPPRTPPRPAASPGGDASSSGGGGSQRGGASSHRPASAGPGSAGPTLESKGGGKVKRSPTKQSNREAAASATALLSDARPKPTGSKSNKPR